jgi:hypothetical protein
MTSRGIFIARTLQGEFCFDRHPQLPVGSKLGDRFEGDDAGWKHAEPLRLQVAAYRLRPHDGRLVEIEGAPRSGKGVTKGGQVDRADRTVAIVLGDRAAPPERS